MTPVVRVNTTSLANLFDTFFERDFGSFEEEFRQVKNNLSIPSYPVANHFVDKDDNYVIEIAVTGIPEENIEVLTEGDTLIIKSSGKEQDKTDKDYVYQHLPYRGFEQKFSCSAKVDLQNLKAEVKLGVLTITIPRKEESKPVKKQIKFG